MDRSQNNPVEGAAERQGISPPGPEMVKERETKEDGRYIIFYAFDDEGEEDKVEDSGEDSTS